MKTALIIMDGWGKELDKERSAIAKANTPFVDSLYKDYPNASLITFGKDVGLPEGQMGNSEVGHMNIGAGRIVYQELQRVHHAIETGELARNKALLACFTYAKEHQKALHFMGLVSDGGVHSHINHVKALCTYAQDFGLEKVYVHCFTDGRDCAPQSGLGFIKDLENFLKNKSAKIASVVGRYYAMDRDKRWERVAKAYQLLVNGVGNTATNISEAIQASYKAGINDEFIEPIVHLDEKGKALATIQEGDAVICFNFRTDRCREITEVLTQKDYPDFGMKKMRLHYTTLTSYDDSFKNVEVIFHKDNIENTLGEVLASNGKTQVRMAETEKYPHVSFFFSGGREKPFEGEHRIMVHSPKVATYDLQPEMSAFELKDAAIAYIKKEQPDFLCLNFANTDMVGHTGIFSAAMKAAETVDSCVQELTTCLLDLDYSIFLTADHGNADIMIQEDGTPHTAHTLNLVPLFFMNKAKSGQLKNGKLADIAPSILHVMGLTIPKEMTGDVLLS